jgi:hypothetical protein
MLRKVRIHLHAGLTPAGTAMRLAALSLFFALAACQAGPGSTPTPSNSRLDPSPTASTEPLLSVTDTPAPISQSSPAVVIEPPLPIPTGTLPPASVGVPQEELAIFLPGPGSQVISPIQIQGYGGPSRDNRVELRLYGEDGRLISRGYTFLYSYPGRPGLYYGQVPFESSSLAELAWLQVRSYGDRFGLLKHMTTMPVTLLTSGNPRIERNLHGPEKITIYQPVEETNVRGPKLQVKGAAWLDEDLPLGVEVLDLRGNVIASAEVAVDAPAVGALGTFELEIELALNRSQWLRLGVYERGSGPVDVIHYASVQFWYIP